MCGIAGFIADGGGPAREESLRRMVGVLRHRGPDGTGVYLDSHAGLGHARLSIIDVAGGGQPIHNEDASLWIVFNGEIFNYLELRSELGDRGHQFATRSDTEVILHAFEEWGESCVSRFNGQWAFAIWDSRRQSLFLSRDRLGVRPLFFTFVGSAFVFASEIKSLFVYPGTERALDLEGLNEIFTFWHTLPPRTAFRGVHELPPAHSATLANGKLNVKRYWELDYQAAAEATGDGTVAEQRLAEELLAILKDATRLRLRSDVPVGAYLSGGLDSTLIAALVKDCGVARLTTFSVRFDEAELDEGPFQGEAVRYLGTDHRDIRCSNQEIGRVFADVIWHAETPIIRTAPAPLYLLSQLVRSNGYKVVLTGEGADEILGGYDIFKEVKIRAFWAEHPASRLRPLLLRRLYPYMPQIQSQPPSYVKAFFHINPEDTRSPFFSHLPRWRLTSRLKCLFSDAVKAEIGAEDPIAAMEALLPSGYSQWDPFTRAQYLETGHLLPGYILSSQGDRMAMAHSVEGRFPFLDHRLAEFASRLPPRLKMNALKEKFLLKRCAGRLIPPAVASRPKQPYRAPDSRSFFGGLRHDYVEELVSPDRIRNDGIFNPVAVQRLVEKARNGNVTSTGDNMAVVGVLSTQLLIDRFITHFEPGI
jgi:asparagine synthase (glutamine-hydrolysing)